MDISDKLSVTGKKWLKLPSDSQKITDIMNIYQLDIVISELLVLRNIPLHEIEHFLNPKLKYYLPNPMTLCNMDKACELLFHHLRQGSLISILSDYDVDGITSLVLLHDFLNQEVLKNNFANFKLQVYIPDRYKEGYGISKQAVDQFIKDNTKLVILLDNGSVAHSEIDILKQYHIDVIVIDHHTVDNQLLKANALVNPKQLNDTSGLDYLCTAGLTFMFLVACCKKQVDKLSSINLLAYLDLVAIGTIADMVPLVQLNRAFVKQGLKLLRRFSNESINALLVALNNNKQVIDTDTIGFTIGPLINSSSRMGNSYLAFNLLTAKQHNQIDSFTKELLQLNQQRQLVENQALNDAINELSKQPDLNDKNHILIGSADWLSGIVGIVASRLKDNYLKPALVYSINHENIGIGSGRSVDGIDLSQIILAAKQKGLLLKAGGHAKAVGFSFDVKNYTALTQFINDKIQQIHSNILSNSDDKYLYIDSILSLNAINMQLYNTLEDLKPWGLGFSEPQFMICKVYIKDVKIIGKHQNHLMVIMQDHNKSYLQGFCYKCIPSALGKNILASKKTYVNIVGKIKASVYNGDYKVNFNILDIMYI